jgi:hypothetical protein
VEERSSSVAETDDAAEAIGWLALALLFQTAAEDDQIGEEARQTLADLIAGD